MPRKKEVTEVEVEEVKLDSGKQKALKQSVRLLQSLLLLDVYVYI